MKTCPTCLPLRAPRPLGVRLPEAKVQPSADHGVSATR